MKKIFATFPFSSALSKNRMWRRSKHGGYYLACAKLMVELVCTISAAIAKEGIRFHPRLKTKVDIFIHRPDIKSDPSNFIDAINDAVSKATGVNDRFFSGSYDWEMNKKNPRFQITITQD